MYIDIMKEDSNDISILVIEKSDDYIFSYNILFNLFLPSYEMFYVKTFSELQRKISNNSHFCIAICEIFILGANWEDILHNIKGKVDNIIFTSAYDRKFPPVKNLINKGYSYMEKPFEIDELKEMVDLKLSNN